MIDSVLLIGFDAAGKLLAKIVAEPGSPGTCKLVKPSPNAPLALARLLVRAPAEQRYLLLDFIPTSTGLPSDRNRLEVTVDSTQPTRVVTMEFRGELRRYLPIEGPLWLHGRLKAHGADLHWTSFHLHYGHSHSDFDHETSLWNPPQFRNISADNSVAVLNQLGLRINAYLAPTFGFVLSPRPVPISASMENLDETLVSKPPDEAPIVVRIKQRLPLDPEQVQQLRSGEFHLRIFPWLVRRLRLHSNRPLELAQTHMGLDRNAKMNEVQNCWILRIKGIPTPSALDAYNRVAIRYHGSLQAVSAGRPVSGVPLFDDRLWRRYQEAQDPFNSLPENHPLVKEIVRRWTLTFDVHDRATLSDPDANDFLRILTVRFRGAYVNDPSTAPPENSVAAFKHATWLPGIARHDLHLYPNALQGSPYPGVVAWDVVNERVPELFPTVGADPCDTYPESLSRGFVLRLGRRFRKGVAPGHPFTPENGLQWVRMGSLDLGFLSAEREPPEFEEPGPIDIQRKQRCLVTIGWRDALGDWSPDVPSVALELRLRVERVLPGGQDGLPDEPFVPVDVTGLSTSDPRDPSDDGIKRRFIREVPLIIPACPPDDLPRSQALLRLRESAGPYVSQDLTINLFGWEDRDALPAEPLPLIVIDRQPFLIALVMAPPLVGIGGPDGNLEIGNWSTSGYEGASWELAGASDGFQLVFPPQAVGEGMEKRALGDVQEGQPAQFRLSPTAKFELVSSYFRKAFVDATWNLRRILGYPGQRGEGAGVHTLRFELLYGMGCHVVGEGLRLAEISSRLGGVPKDLSTQPSRILGKHQDDGWLDDLEACQHIFGRLRYRWSRQYEAYAARLAVFEPRFFSPSGLTLRSGVNYQLRSPAEIMRDPAAPEADDPNLLAGGSLWGFEFQAQYRPFVQYPERRRSTAGELSGLAFSALGGWGHQKAVFQNGLTTIYSDTAMGRTFFYSVERRGRISKCWNFAKHVVIYERTVGTAKQFRRQSDGSISQDHHAGRPVLRKVREFVEILQAKRSFPDLGGGEVARGCLQGIEFQSTIIPVDSRWGHDVFETVDGALTATGYVIPLWREGADPGVYPKPHVCLRVAGAGSADESLVCDDEEPQKFFFYSRVDVTPGDKELNTDDWEAVRTVDFPDSPWPVCPAPSVPSDGRLDRPLPDEQAIAPGYELFTHKIMAPKPINVVANRVKTTLGATLRNVTIVRADPRITLGGNAGKATQAAEAQAAMSETRTAMAEIDRLLRADLTDAAAREQLKRHAETVREKVTRVGAALNGIFVADPLPGGKFRDFPKIVDVGIRRWHEQASAILEGDLKNNLIPELRALANLTDADALKKHVIPLLRQSWDVVRLAAPGVDPGLNELLHAARRAARLLETIAKSLEPQVTDAIICAEKVLDSPLWDVAPSEEDKAALRQLVHKTVDGLIAAVRALVVQAMEAVTGHFGRQLAQECGKVTEQAIQVFEGWREEAIGVLDGSIDEIVDAFDGLWQRLTDFVAAAKVVVDTVTGVVKELEKKLEEFRQLKTAGGLTLGSIFDFDGAQLEKLVGDIAGLTEPKRILEAALGSVDRFERGVKELTSGAGIQDPGQVIARLDQVQHVLSTLPGDLLTEVTDSVKDSLDATAFDALVTAVENGSGDLRKLTHELRSKLDLTRTRFDGIVHGLAQPLATKFPKGMVQQAGRVLRMVRAFGDAPVVEGMEFTRQRLGYFYDPFKSVEGSPVDMTPAVALVNRVGGHLKGVGIAFPTGKLLDQILPPPDALMKSLDIGKMLPDFAGLKLDKLFPDLKAPAGLKDKVKITQDFDKQSGRGWVQADVTVRQNGPSTLFDAGALKVALRRIDLQARIRIEGGASGAPKRTQWGKLKADWDLSLGSTALVSFLETELSFDESGKTKFTLDPTKIRLNGILSMLSDVIRLAGKPGSGFTLRIKEVDGKPVGVEALLKLPLPSITFGVCGLSNLMFGAEVGLVAVPEFSIELRVHVCEKRLPFAITIFILGGGGWLDARGRYLPGTGRLVTSVSLGLAAGAIIDIEFGPVKGCVYAFFFVEGEMNSDSAKSSGAQLVIRVGLLLGGRVDFYCMVTVHIELVLELEYTGQTGSLAGRGSLSIRVKICMFLTLSFSQTVEKRFAGSGGQRSLPSDEERRKRVEQACDDHLAQTA